VAAAKSLTRVAPELSGAVGENKEEFGRVGGSKDGTSRNNDEPP